MALSCFVGSFTIPTAGGTPVSKSITGVGFQPKLVLFFGTTQSSDADVSTQSTNIALTLTILGFAVDSTHRAVIFSDDDGSASVRAPDSTLCIKSQVSSVITYAADFVSMDADGFTLSFTTINATAYIVNYMAIGGADLTNVASKSFTTPTGAPPQSSPQTGIGFKPDAMILIGGRANSVGIGLVSSTTTRGASSLAKNGGYARYQRTVEAYVETSDTAKLLEADLSSFDSDGFTLNFTTTNAVTSTLIAICMKGGKFNSGNFLQKTSTTTQPTTGNGFTPTGLIILSVENTASTTVDTSADGIMVGMASGATARAVTFYEDDGSYGWGILNRTQIVRNAGQNGSVNCGADLSSFDADGFTLSYATADATAREMLYFAFGSTGGAPADILMGQGVM
jgi:hypothetical protein